MKNVAFIINPFSSTGNYQPFLKKLQQTVPDAQYYISESISGTENYIRNNFDSTDVFVAVGGDGTISHIAKHLINTEKVLAVFPAGSGNGFSRETHFEKDLKQLLEKIETFKIKEVDTFTVNEHFSINVSGAGFDGKVAKEFEKTQRGFANYIKVSISTFFNYKPVKLKFEDPALQSYNGRYLMLNVANTRQFGNNAFIAPKASKSDGLVDLVLVKKFPLHYAALFAYRMFTKTLKDDQYVSYISVSETRFSVSTENWHIDGEFTQIKSPVHIKVLPKSLKILI